MTRDGGCSEAAHGLSSRHDLLGVCAAYDNGYECYKHVTNHNNVRTDDPWLSLPTSALGMGRPGSEGPPNARSPSDPGSVHHPRAFLKIKEKEKRCFFVAGDPAHYMVAVPQCHGDPCDTEGTAH